jgi:hypothetical protein
MVLSSAIREARSTWLDQISGRAQMVALRLVLYGTKDPDGDVSGSGVGFEPGQKIPGVLGAQHDIENDGARRHALQNFFGLTRSGGGVAWKPESRR